MAGDVCTGVLLRHVMNLVNEKRLERCSTLSTLLWPTLKTENSESIGVKLIYSEDSL